MELVSKYGRKNWAFLSELMNKYYNLNTRSGKQCRERWHNHLNPKVSKKEWTKEEE